jgi:hypothetical protein
VRDDRHRSGEKQNFSLLAGKSVDGKRLRNGIQCRDHPSLFRAWLGRDFGNHLRLPLLRRVPHQPRIEGLGGEHRQDHDGAKGQRADPGLDGDHRAKCDQGAEQRLRKMCIDAATRIVGCFVTIKGMGLIFLGITEAIRDYVLELEGTH